MACNGKIFGNDDFSCCEPREFGVETGRRRFADFEASRRNVGGRNTYRFPDRRNRNEPVGCARLEQGFLGQSARRDDADDPPRDDRFGSARLGGGGTLRLFGNGDAVAGLDQSRKIGLHRMNGHAAHRYRGAQMFAARCKGNIEHRCCNLSVVKEELEEVAHAVKQQAIRCFCLQREILRHHGSGRSVSHDPPIAILPTGSNPSSRLKVQRLMD